MRVVTSQNMHMLLCNNNIYCNDCNVCCAGYDTLHDGFSHAYLSPSVENHGAQPMTSAQEAIAKAVSSFAVPGRTRVYFAGHSLGGAVATVAAFDAGLYMPARTKVPWSKYEPYKPLTVAGVYTFGSPQVCGLEVFKKASHACDLQHTSHRSFKA